MANRIKGITVEIGGDTTKLQDALKGVNKEIKNTQSELRDVNKLLKLDPGNTDLITQKQKILGQSIEETKKKLESLKLAQEQASKALADGTITSSQYDALQREIIETENALKSLEQQASTTANSLKEISEGSMKVSKVTGDVGKELTTKVTVPLTAIGALGLKTAMDFEQGMSSVKAITGATGDQLEALKEQALELGESTSFSASEVTEAMTEMAKAGWSTEDILSGIAGVLDASAASGENLGSVSTIVADAISGFNLEASESGRVADVLTQAANAGTIGINDLGESFKYIAPLSASMGFNIEDVTSALTAMSMSGIKGSQAGTSLKNTLTNLIRPTKSMQEAMDTLGISITNQDGSFKSLDEILAILRNSFSGLTDEQKAYYASVLAGKEGQAGLLSLLNLTQEEYDEITKSMQEAGGVAKETADIMQDNLASKVEALGGALETLSIRLGDLVIPAITCFVEKITDIVTAFANLDPAVQGVILTIVGIAAAVGPVLLIVSKVSAIIGTVTGALAIMAGGVTTGATPAMLGLAKVFGVVKTAFTGLIGLISAHPLVAVIVAAAAILIPLIIKNWESIKEFLVNTWNSIVETAQNIWGGITEFFSNLWTGIAETWNTIWTSITSTLSALWTGFIETIKPIWTGVKDFFSNLWQGISETWSNTWTTITTNLGNLWTSFIEGAKNLWKTVGEFFTSLWEGISQTFTSAWDSIQTNIQTVQQNISDFINTTWESIKTFIGNTLGGIKTKVEEVWKAISSSINTILTEIQNFLNTTWTSIKSNIENILNQIKTVVTNVWNQIKTTITNVMNTIKTGLNNAWNQVKTNITNTMNSAKTSVTNAFNSMQSKISSTMSNIVSTIKNGFNNAVSFIKNLASQAYKWGADMIDGIARGIRNSIGKITSEVKNVANTIRSYLHFSVPDVGPLTDYETWMPDFMEGLSKGIESSRHLVKSSIDNVARDMVLSPKMALAGNINQSTVAIDIGKEIQSAIKGHSPQIQETGDIVIPVYLGGTLLDEVIVSASMRRNLRSGGR